MFSSPRAVELSVFLLRFIAPFNACAHARSNRAVHAVRRTKPTSTIPLTFHSTDHVPECRIEGCRWGSKSHQTVPSAKWSSKSVGSSRCQQWVCIWWFNIPVKIISDCTKHDTTDVSYTFSPSAFRPDKSMLFEKSNGLKLRICSNQSLGTLCGFLKLSKLFVKYYIIGNRSSRILLANMAVQTHVHPMHLM